jgi:hypothetical protein
MFDDKPRRFPFALKIVAIFRAAQQIPHDTVLLVYRLKNPEWPKNQSDGRTLITVTRHASSLEIGRPRKQRSTVAARESVVGRGHQ